ncbi:MAG: hypothetical protein E2O67_05280 [Deltaproteobacteria bacterium]|nr:MAG: hypothetical protein E2O67_05280 [Deltaproteobacteria bacterium]
MSKIKLFKILILVILIIISFYVGYYHMIGKHKTEPTDKDMKQSQEVLEHLLQTKFLGATEIDQSNDYLLVTVDPHKWNDMPLNQKELMLIPFWQTNQLAGKKPWVDIKNKNTGKIIAKYRHGRGLKLE